MEEISALHNLNLEWGCITNLMDKISDIEDMIEGGWPELVDMVADAVTEEGENKDPASAFFNLYQFLWRLYYRLKSKPEKRPFNKVTRAGGTVSFDAGEILDPDFRIYNYDYATFKWLKTVGCMDKLTNDYAYVPKDKLTDKQWRTLDRRCK